MQELQDRVEDKVLECITMAEEALKHTFPMIPIRYDLKGKCAGQFCTRGFQKYFRINMVLLAENTEHYLAQTVPHEVSHYITKMISPMASSHGREWQSVMTRIMHIRADRCHSYDISNSTRNTVRFEYKCNCRTHQISKIRHNRIIRENKSYICKACSTALTIA